jgi:hypothetical protein
MHYQCYIWPWMFNCTLCFFYSHQFKKNVPTMSQTSPWNHYHACLILPVIRLFGSKTSIFSNKSAAPAEILGNLAAKFCLGYCGSCLTYLRAFSLRRKPRQESSGEPMSYSKINAQGVKLIVVPCTTSKKTKQIRMWW